MIMKGIDKTRAVEFFNRMNMDKGKGLRGKKRIVRTEVRQGVFQYQSCEYMEWSVSLSLSKGGDTRVNGLF